MNTAIKLTRARTRLLLSQPFFGALALRMQPVPADHLDTMGTDGKTLFYNPDFVESLSMDELVGVLAHEVMHPACQHHTRRGGRDPKRWNIAADYAINPIILDNGFTLPEGALVDAAYSGLSAEAIYARLPEPQESGNGGTGQSACPDPGRCGGIMDATDSAGHSSPAASAAAESECRQALAQAATIAKNTGKLPGTLARLVDEILNPKVDWREVLRRFIENTTRQEYRWTPPNRRFVHQGLYLPSCRSEGMPPMAVAIDTSASVTQEEMNQFAAELNAILVDCMPEEVHVLYCDSTLQRVDVLSPHDLPLSLEAMAGGGTDFRPPFEWLEDADISPACIVYLTDLQCSNFPDEPSCPTLWATTASPDILGYYGAPPFGEIVYMN